MVEIDSVRSRWSTRRWTAEIFAHSSPTSERDYSPDSRRTNASSVARRRCPRSGCRSHSTGTCSPDSSRSRHMVAIRPDRRQGKRKATSASLLLLGVAAFVNWISACLESKVDHRQTQRVSFTSTFSLNLWSSEFEQFKLNSFL